MNLTDLKRKPVPELIEIAESRQIEGIARARKQDLFFSILNSTLSDVQGRHSVHGLYGIHVQGGFWTTIPRIKVRGRLWRLDSGIPAGMTVSENRSCNMTK